MSDQQVRLYTLSDLLLYLWNERLSIALGAAVGFCLALVLFFTLKPQYEIWMIVTAPREGVERFDFLTDQARPFLVSGSDQTALTDREYMRFQQSLRGPAVAAVLLRMDGMLGGLQQDTLFQGGASDMSGSGDVANYLERHVRMDPVKNSESLRLTYHHPDPDVGVKLLRNLVRIGDQLIRQDARRDVDARIEWVRRELKMTLNPEHRQTLTRMLMGEERREMLLSIDTPYALSIVEDASASPRPVFPKPMLFFPVLMMACMVMGLVLSYLRVELGKRRTSHDVR